MKIGFVVQRCGPDVYGGAEALTLQIGQNLSNLYEVEILTTRAKDAATWKDHYPEGIEKIDNLTIRRFSVDRERDPKFVPLSQYLEVHNNDIQKGAEFVNASGPVCNKLINFIKENKDNYDLFVFVGYLYWQTLYGMQIVPDKSILLSTAHDEPWIYFKIFEKVFEIPHGYMFLTNSEKEFVHKKFGYTQKPFQVVGHGMDVNMASRHYRSATIKLPKNYVLYIGRISAGKGCQQLSDFFNQYVEIHHNTDLKLVMLGNLEHPIINNKAIILQNLSDEEKYFVLQNCKIFIMSSQFESLNMACLEAWLFKKPVLVNGDSTVLVEHCRKGQCGLYFRNYEEFSECLDMVLYNEKFADDLGINGEIYVKENYNWDITIKKYNELLYKVSDKALKTH